MTMLHRGEKLRGPLVFFSLFAVAGLAVTVLLGKRDASIRTEQLASQSKLLVTSHGQIEYAEWGTGSPVLAIHGAGGGFDQGRLLADALGPSDRRWIAISRFGYLRSDLPEDASPAAQAAAIHDLLMALQIEEVDILAMSGGVPPALKFAELYPAKTKRMALLSPAPFTPLGTQSASRPIPTWLYSAMLGNDVVFWVLTKVARGQLAKAFDARPDLRRDLPAEESGFIDNLIDGFSPASQRVVGVNNEGAAIAPGQSFDLASISAPVLIIHASDDSINPPEIAEALAERVSEADAIAYQSGGHLLLGHHREIKRTLRSFFAE